MTKKSMSLAGIGIATFATAIATMKYMSRRRSGLRHEAVQAEQDVQRFEDEGGTTQPAMAAGQPGGRL